MDPDGLKVVKVPRSMETRQILLETRPSGLDT
jgi:hypothetical protein